MRQSNDRLVVLSGRMFAGKDYVAKAAGLTIRGFADPIYELCEFFQGTANKSAPGIRKFMQQLGQWGWGCVSEAYPHDAERAVITMMIRKHGSEMTSKFKWVRWDEFGRRNDFWVNIALMSLGLTPETRQSFLLERPAYNLAITNARFAHELQPCMRAGFEHYHVRCSEETRRERMMMSGYEYQPKVDADASEQMARDLDADMPELKVVWNDFVEPPKGKHFMTVQEFVEHLALKGLSQDLVTKSAPKLRHSSGSYRLAMVGA